MERGSRVDECILQKWLVMMLLYKAHHRFLRLRRTRRADIRIVCQPSPLCMHVCAYVCAHVCAHVCAAPRGALRAGPDYTALLISAPLCLALCSALLYSIPLCASAALCARVLCGSAHESTTPRASCRPEPASSSHALERVGIHLFFPVRVKVWAHGMISHTPARARRGKVQQYVNILNITD